MNGTLSGILAILIWSLTATFVFFTGEVPPLLMTFIVFLIGSITLTLGQYVRKEKISTYWTQPLNDYIFLVIGIGFYTSLVFLSFKLVPIFEANALNYLWPILLVLFYGLSNKNNLQWNTIIGIILGFFGVLALFWPQDGQTFFSKLEWGHILAICAALLWATYSVLSRKRKYPVGSMAPALFYSSILCLGFHLKLEETIWPQGWEWTFIIILGVTRISYSFWDYGMKHGNVILLSSLSYFIPLISLSALTVIGAGPENASIGLGAIFIVTGCFVANSDKILKYFKRKE